jgi:hypothetical protein
MSNPNANADVPAFHGNAAAPVYAPYAESIGSIVGPASIPTQDGSQSPFHPAIAEWLAPNLIDISTVI